MSDEEKTSDGEAEQQHKRTLAINVLKSLAIGGAFFSGQRVQAHGNASSHGRVAQSFSPTDFVLRPSPRTFSENFIAAPKTLTAKKEELESHNQPPPSISPIGGAALKLEDKDELDAAHTSVPKLPGKDLVVQLDTDGDGVLFTSPFPGAEGLQQVTSTFFSQDLTSKPEARLVFTYFAETDDEGKPKSPSLEMSWSAKEVDENHDGVKDLEVKVRDLGQPESQYTSDFQTEPAPAHEGQSFVVKGRVSKKVRGERTPIPIAFTGCKIQGYGISSFRLRQVEGTGLTSDPTSEEAPAPAENVPGPQPNWGLIGITVLTATFITAAGIVLVVRWFLSRPKP